MKMGAERAYDCLSTKQELSLNHNGEGKCEYWVHNTARWEHGSYMSQHIYAQPINNPGNLTSMTVVDYKMKIDIFSECVSYASRGIAKSMTVCHTIRYEQEYSRNQKSCVSYSSQSIEESIAVWTKWHIIYYFACFWIPGVKWKHDVYNWTISSR